MIRAALVFLLLSAPVGALQLPEGAVIAASDESARDTLTFPVGPWNEEGTPVQRMEGAIRREAWHLPGSQRTTAEILAPLKDSLEEDGYNILYTCVDTDCGGFDFRFDLDLIPEPDMHVDLGDYRYLAARKSGAKDVVVVTVSRSTSTGFIHIARAGPSAPAATSNPKVPLALPVPAGPIIEQLETTGHAVLEDLEFSTGSATLEARAFPSLSDLAKWLRADPSRRIVLVGHSDGVGALDRNIALSRERAQAVVVRLAEAHDIDPARLSAEGIGYLSPRASNSTDEGRAVNRRVEVVIVSP